MELWFFQRDDPEIMRFMGQLCAQQKSIHVVLLRAMRHVVVGTDLTRLLYVLVLVYSHWEATHINARSARF